MPKFQIIVLSLYLGFATAGCYPAYSPGGTYSKGSAVSQVVTVTTPVVYTVCTPPSSTCINGWIQTGGVTTSSTHNYVCLSDDWCSNVGYAPGGVYTDLAWTKVSTPCTGPQGGDAVSPFPTPVPSAAPTPAIWAGVACPNEYVKGAAVAPGASVTVTKNGVKLVYTCNADTTSGWCPLTGYEPGSGSAWQQAWKLEGSCSGTSTPKPTSAAPTPALWAGVACPPAYVKGAAVAPGDSRTVTKDGVKLVYTCNADPTGGWCPMEYYEPGTGQAWKMAWKLEGSCDGTSTLKPTSAAPTPALWAGVACPDAYVKGAAVAPGASRTVTKDGLKLVYTCAPYPASGWCPLAGYEPGSGLAWQQAWKLEGSCDGTSTHKPTSAAPTPALWAGVACPDAYVRGAAVAPGASRTVTKDGLKLVYTCAPYPASGWCPLAGYEPGSGLAWQQAWKLEGSCDDTKTFTPTVSPVSSLPNQGGCPAAYATGVTYEAGDVVSKGGMVFKCHAYPLSLFCSQIGYEPLKTEHGGAYKLAWMTVGSCSGTIAPATSSPISPTAIAAAGGCPASYSYGVAYRGGDRVSKVTSNPTVVKKYECKAFPESQYCSLGTYAPGGDFGYMAWIDLGQCFGTLSPTVTAVCNFLKYTSATTYTITTTQIWSQQDYAVGDEVRIGNKAFKCKVAGWCNQFNYAPSLSAGLWADAWDAVGDCKSNTYSPTSSPTTVQK